ncbi:5-formyltetrahydrofolate cyclo-ligase [uncultured Methanobrevibacter sp.]|uniref:5-formyltetrahydrofolate cyclo-ligase n=1 Tax=uncultured Methanobrevibacter sp. TaxID=253161 RepID=UPI002631DAA3
MSLKEEKESLRKSVYDSLFENGFSKRPNGDYGKIPDFIGSDIAAQLLASTPEWKNSKTIFVSPDSAQIPVRYLALKDNKNLIMASPNLEHGYLFLEASQLKGFEKEASTKEGAFKYANEEKTDLLNKGENNEFSVDMVVEGAVAVDKSGNRIGKGKGYGDREIEDLLNRKFIDNNTRLLTTIHPLQLVSHVPMEIHDRKLNMIVTSKEIFRI